jgi:lambda family phage minor tail protein L
MARPLSSAARSHKDSLASASPWVWLYEIEVPTSTPTRYRLARHNQAITFNGNEYVPFPVAHASTTENTKGDLPTVTMTISNIGREVTSNLESYNGLIGQPVRIMLVSLEDLDSSSPVMQEEYEILSVSARDDHVSASLGTYNALRATFPAQRAIRDHCRHVYRSAECGYSVSSGDAQYLSSCDKSFDGVNGCVAHGTSEKNSAEAGGAAGTDPGLHPQRFGGYPGIPRPGATGGI